VVPTTAPQEGLTALLAFDPARDVGENARAVADAASALRLGGVAPAARDDAQGRFKKGDAVGFVDGEILAWGGAGSTLTQTMRHLAEGAEILTLIAGEGAPIPLAELDTHTPDGVEVETHEGGQPSWWWLLAAQ
jgi:dihydroxyacetone kinase-like predicted kinase